MIYLDWAATSPPDEGCLEEGTRVSREAFGNPSSQHPAGRIARDHLEAARASLAESIGCSPSEVVFTSGATESNWLAISSVMSRIRPDAAGRRPVSVVASGIEHASVHDNLETLERLGVRVAFIPAAPAGSVRIEDLMARVEADTVMLLLMTVNNVTGALQPVAELAAAAHRYAEEHGRRITVHADSVQALGKIPFDVRSLGVDTASFSAHKICGPRGVGALYVRDGAYLEPLLRGGEQEHGIRPGTENVAGAAAFACASRARVANLEAEREHAGRLQGVLLEALGTRCRWTLVPEARLPPRQETLFSPFIICLAFPPIPSEVLVRVLSSHDICVSSGSACASKSKDKRERVYRNMGVPAAVAAAAIRISTGPRSSEEEMVQLAEVLARETPRLARIAG